MFFFLLQCLCCLQSSFLFSLFCCTLGRGSFVFLRERGGRGCGFHDSCLFFFFSFRFSFVLSPLGSNDKRFGEGFWWMYLNLAEKRAHSVVHVMATMLVLYIIAIKDRLTLLKVIFDPSWNTDQGVLELRECSGSTKPTTRSESEKWKKLFLSPLSNKGGGRCWFKFCSPFFLAFFPPSHKEKKKKSLQTAFRRNRLKCEVALLLYKWAISFLSPRVGIPLQHPPIWTFVPSPPPTMRGEGGVCTKRKNCGTSASPSTRKIVNYACVGWSQRKLWWRSVAILTCKSFVICGYRGERPIELSSSWFPPKFPSG